MSVDLITAGADWWENHDDFESGKNWTPPTFSCTEDGLQWVEFPSQDFAWWFLTTGIPAIQVLGWGLFFLALAWPILVWLWYDTFPPTPTPVANPGATPFMGVERTEPHGCGVPGARRAQ